MSIASTFDTQIKLFINEIQVLDHKTVNYINKSCLNHCPSDPLLSHGLDLTVELSTFLFGLVTGQLEHGKPNI